MHTTNASVQNDKRPLYVWVIVLLANINVFLLIMLLVVSEAIIYRDPMQHIFDKIFTQEFLYIQGTFILISVAPIFISKASNRWVRKLGYGIPLLLLLPIPYFIYDYYTCRGKLCELSPLILGSACAISSVVITLFYTLGRKVHTWKSTSFLSIIGIQILLLFGVLFKLYQMILK